VKVYFLRHGIAIDAEVWDGSDFDRPLTPDGKERMKREAKAMARLGIVPELVLTSPLLRAKQTAAIVAQRLNLADRLSEDERLGLGFGAGALRAIAAERKATGTLMLVGHEPSMSATIGDVTGGSRVELKKGGLACVDLDDDDDAAGTLAWLLTPKLLLG
jgi:phosphohistidine phosphatase